MPYFEGGRYVPNAIPARSLSAAATTQSPPFSPGQVAASVAIAINVSAIGGTTPNMTFSVQWSNDGTNWYTADPADTFTAITATGKVVKTFASKGALARLNEVFTGTTPTITYNAEVWTL